MTRDNRARKAKNLTARTECMRWLEENERELSRAKAAAKARGFSANTSIWISALAELIVATNRKEKEG